MKAILIDSDYNFKYMEVESYDPIIYIAVPLEINMAFENPTYDLVDTNYKRRIFKFYGLNNLEQAIYREIVE